ncbi:UPF0715 family protein [Cytobacillus purgationiresistens]|uniref:Energy-coupling factor transporter transmembrane protein EcfT n=1 Tax=Cytobacillus purgationiresistens TaxID=863449 RepID=A0ABU0APM2_9BACI|nr:UPF0715 family protein [Cytobacillus purgationiresistens]MDQ0272809.1 energy-coupling factor transporter transmembrane protein EcfT [Cytobacillus purgationiresistens]
MGNLNMKASHVSDVIPYYFISLLLTSISYSFVLSFWNGDTNWGMAGVVFYSLFGMIPFLIFAVPIQVILNKKPKKFNFLYLIVYLFFALIGIIILYLFYNDSFNVEILREAYYYKLIISAAVIFWLWDSVFLQKENHVFHR